MLQNVDEDSDEYREIFESQLFYLGTFGLEDPVREDINIPIHYIKYGHMDMTQIEPREEVVIKMITGDHIETAKSIAVAAGIVSENNIEDEGVAMTGEDFRAAIGNYKVLWN